MICFRRIVTIDHRIQRAPALRNIKVCKQRSIILHLLRDRELSMDLAILIPLPKLETFFGNQEGLFWHGGEFRHGERGGDVHLDVHFRTEGPHWGNILRDRLPDCIVIELVRTVVVGGDLHFGVWDCGCACRGIGGGCFGEEVFRAGLDEEEDADALYNRPDKLIDKRYISKSRTLRDWE